MGETKHFVLVHGFCHGGWCWYKLVTMLKSNGHRVTALDMAGCGINQKQFDEISSLSEYVQPLMDFMSSLSNDEKVILVGHSYGGLVISLAMENFPEKISMGVFVTAFMPNFNDTPVTQLQELFKRRGSELMKMDNKFRFDKGTEKPATSAVFGPDYMAAEMYQNCSLKDMELAKMLIRPNSFFTEDLENKSLLSEEKYGKIRRCFVVCEADAVMLPDFQRYIIEKSPPDYVISSPGAPHMFMLSNPHQLCIGLQQLAQKY